MSAGSTRAILLALGANLGIALAKGLAALFTRSGSMLAEAIHSLADCANQLLLLLGMKRARRAPTEEHPLGHGKEIYFWSFLVAVLLFSVGGIFSLYEGVHKFQHPEPVHMPGLALGILGLSIVLEAISFRGCLREIRHAAAGQRLRSWLREARESELLVVLAEDSAALLGLGLAALAVLLTMLTGDSRFDAAGSCAVGLLLVAVAVWLVTRIKAMIVGQSASPTRRHAIRQHIADRPEVERVLHLVTLQLGHGLMVAVKAKMRERATPQQMIEDINRCERELRIEYPDIAWIFFEPDSED